MAVFKAGKTRNSPAIPNYYLWNLNLTLKTKALLSILLSLPDTESHTIQEISAIAATSVATTKKYIRELEAAGYIVCQQLRDEDGKIIDTEYVFYDHPVAPGDSDGTSND